MRVITSEDNELKFDNGLLVTGTHDQSCCENNYLDFEQLPVGTELEDMGAVEFIKAVTLKDDGFIIKDIQGTPKWVQARSRQNGYYSHSVDMRVSDESITLVPKKPGQDEWQELFTAGEDDEY